MVMPKSRSSKIGLWRILDPSETRDPLVPSVSLDLFAFLCRCPRRLQYGVVLESLCWDIFEQWMGVEMVCHPFVQICVHIDECSARATQVNDRLPFTSVMVYKIPLGLST